jgi:hypothetical protein
VSCITCNWGEGYVYLPNGTCTLFVPVGMYNNSGYADYCDNRTMDCGSCENQAVNCTSCLKFYLQGNLCLEVCYPGFVGIGG